MDILRISVPSKFNLTVLFFCILTWKNIGCKYKKRFALHFWANLFLRKIICKFSFKTHQQNLNFSPYNRGSFLNGVFLFGFHFIKIFSLIIWKEGFVCVKIAAVSFFFCRTVFLMNGYHPTSLSFILFLFGQKTLRGKVFGRCLWLRKAVRCVHPLAEKFCIRLKAVGT